MLPWRVGAGASGGAAEARRSAPQGCRTLSPEPAGIRLGGSWDLKFSLAWAQVCAGGGVLCVSAHEAAAPHFLLTLDTQDRSHQMSWSPYS